MPLYHTEKMVLPVYDHYTAMGSLPFRIYMENASWQNSNELEHSLGDRLLMTAKVEGAVNTSKAFVSQGILLAQVQTSNTF